jgi:predicted outer membrane repeat protein
VAARNKWFSGHCGIRGQWRRDVYQWQQCRHRHFHHLRLFGNKGGAIYSIAPLTITSSNLTGNSATGEGGAVNSPIGLAITSSTLTGNTAADGGAVYMTGSGTIRFSRFYQNTAGTGPAISVPGDVNAVNNWWGTNNGPSGYVLGWYTGTPWLVLGANATPTSITTAGTSLITANLTFNSPAGADTSLSGHIPDGTPVTFAVVTGGSVSPMAADTVNGVAHTVFTPSGSATANISVTVDGQTVYITMPVSPAPVQTPTLPPATLDIGNDDGFPSGTAAPATTGAGTLPPMTVTVNIGGDSKAWQAVVTGTGLRDLIVTGTVQHNSAENQTAPPGTVFQYISLTPARYGTISNTVIYFSIPQSWLDENHIAPGIIVLYHQTANGWEALPTTVVTTKDGTVYFSAPSGGFSLFAIAGTPGSAATPAIVATTQEVQESIVQTPATTTVTKAPVTTQTTAPPATAPQPAAPSPLLNIVLVIAAIGILTGGGFMARRWWIRRQNPALFEEC